MTHTTREISSGRRPAPVRPVRGRLARGGAVLSACLAALIGLGAWSSDAGALTTPALLDSLQRTAFNYFWTEANPSNGLIRDRSASWSPCSIAATGFGLSAICVGVDHGWVSRATAASRVLTTLQTFWTKPQGSGASGTIGYKGLYYHFLDMTTATRTWSCELSTIDTALLFAGILDAKQYFNGSDATEIQIRALADSIYYRADWNFMRPFTQGILMGWKPESGFVGYGQWIGYNEAMILYILALGSPTHGVPTGSWTAWTSGYNWGTQYGQTYVIFPPLFGHQYSHCWVDFRYIQDAYMRGKGITYHENSRRATLAQQAYCIANPGGWVGYGATMWGLTAGDGPTGYNARGAPPAQNDDGTLGPTAPGGSIAFAPEICIPTLHNMYDTYKSNIWGRYGFTDAFNPTVGWWDTDYLGIDEGPIILMIENHLNQRVWNRMMANADIQTGLTRAGFTATTSDVAERPDAGGRPFTLFQNAPNPMRNATTISYRLERAGHVSLGLFDVQGRPVRNLVEGYQPAGDHEVRLDGQDLPSGVYFYRLECDGRREARACLLVR